MNGFLNDHDSSLVAQASINRFESMPDVIVESLKPRIFPDGNQWSCLYGENLQEGICGFGDTPNMAVNDFIKNYYGQKLKSTI